MSPIATGDNDMNTKLQAYPDKRYLPANQVWERYGISFMTLNRWIKRTDIEFPKPIYLGRYRYFDIDELEAFERKRASLRSA